MRVLLLLLLGLMVPIAPAQSPRVVGVGYPGRNTAELAAKLGEALNSVSPTYVIIMVGANDALNEAKFLSTEQSRDNLRRMVQQAEGAGAKVLLVTTHDPDLTRLMRRHKPEDFGSAPPTARLAAMNAAMVQVAGEEQAELVDFSSVLARAGGATAELSTDGVHLTARGYGLLAAAVRTHLPATMTQDDIVLCFGDSLTYGQGVREPGAAETPETYPSQLRVLLRQ